MRSFSVAVKSKRKHRKKPSQLCYARGAIYERTVKKELEREGFFVIRSAGSKSPVDLVAIKGGFFELIQCATRRPKAEAKHVSIKKSAKRIGSPIILVWREKIGRKYVNQYLSIEPYVPLSDGCETLFDVPQEEWNRLRSK